MKKVKTLLASIAIILLLTYTISSDELPVSVDLKLYGT